MRVDAFDPKPQKDSIDLEVSEDLFFRAYYEPFATAIEAGEEADAPQGYIAASFQGNGLRVGMRRDLYGLLQSDITSGSAPWAELLTSNEFVQDRLDGTFVSADWEDATSRKDYDA